MIRVKIENERVLRGQSLHGELYITSPLPYTAKEVKATIVLWEKYSSKLSYVRESKSIQAVLFKEDDIQITPHGRRIPFTYTIPENAPYTFFEIPIRVEWLVCVSVKKSKFSSESKSEKFTVLPHILESGSPPSLENIPKPEYEFRLTEFRSGFTQLWRLVGPFSMSDSFSIHIDKREYSPGDTVSGDILFLNDFGNATLSIYLVFLRRAKALWRPEEREHLIIHKKDTFSSGSRFHFSFPLSKRMCPDFETEHSRISWKLRAIVSKPFHAAKITEHDLKIQPLRY